MTSLEEKFRRSGLTESDEEALRKDIMSIKDSEKLVSLIYIYGRSYNKNDDIEEVCDRYIKRPIPGLTAVCLKVLVDFWSNVRKYEDVISSYINIEKYDIWYDEVIFSVSFVSRASPGELSADIFRKYRILLCDPRADDLLSDLAIKH